VPVLDVSVRGADQLIRLSRKLKAVGDTGLRRETRRALSDAVKPVKAAIRQHELAAFPKHGGLNRVMARSRITTQISGSGRNPGIRIATRTHNPRIDRSGRLTHPVFGHRDRVVVQQVAPGYFTGPANRAAPATRFQLIAAMKRIEKELEAR
jgi:hypothetical protein